MKSESRSPKPKEFGRWLIDELVLFLWWQRLQVRVQTSRWRVLLLALTMFVGVGARIWAQSLPGNWDFGQWVNTSSAVLNGQDPYALFGYNYPPPWLIAITLFNAATSSDSTFRLLIALLLAAADVGIALILARKGYWLAACAFMLSPITIAISGQHQQVESIALFFALAAVATMPVRSTTPGKGDWIAVVLLGVSLSFKPVFLLLPVWLAFRQPKWGMKAFYFALPLGIFSLAIASAFVVYPFEEVVGRVLGHSGANNSPFINAFVPHQLAPWVLDHGGAKLVFLLILVGFGWLVRRRNPFELALIYSVTALVFSWAVVNQYLATPVAATAVFLNVGLLVWFVLSSIYLAGDPGVLGIPGVTTIQQNVLLEWTHVMQDLFPWVFLGWLILAWQLRRPNGIFRPKEMRHS